MTTTDATVETRNFESVDELQIYVLESDAKIEATFEELRDVEYPADFVIETNHDHEITISVA